MCGAGSRGTVPCTVTGMGSVSLLLVTFGMLAVSCLVGHGGARVGSPLGVGVALAMSVLAVPAGQVASIYGG